MRAHLERVIVINDFGSVNGGAAQVAISSALGLARTGLEVDFFCGVGPIDARLTAVGVHGHCLDQYEIVQDPLRVRALTRGVWNIQAATRLRQLLARCNPHTTVVHLHGWTKSVTASVIRAVQTLDFPLVVTMHDYFGACPNGGFFDYQRNEVCRRRALSTDCIRTHCDARSYAQKIWRVGRQYVGSSAAHLPAGLLDVIYLSDFSLRILRPYFSPDTRWHEVHNPVLIEQAPRAKAEENSSFIFLGRLSPEKGVDLFAAAAARAGVRALVIGDGPIRGAFEAAWPDVESKGWLPPQRALEQLQSARALVFPSRWYEAQPLVVPEALASGIPVIVADGTAARDAVRHGENGLLFEHGNTEALAHALRRLTNDSEVAELSKRAYAGYWAAPQTLDRHCENLRNVYLKTLETRAELAQRRTTVDPALNSSVP